MKASPLLAPHRTRPTGLPSSGASPASCDVVEQVVARDGLSSRLQPVPCSVYGALCNSVLLCTPSGLPCMREREQSYAWSGGHPCPPVGSRGARSALLQVPSTMQQEGTSCSDCSRSSSYPSLCWHWLAQHLSPHQRTRPYQNRPTLQRPLLL